MLASVCFQILIFIYGFTIKVNHLPENQEMFQKMILTDSVLSKFSDWQLIHFTRMLATHTTPSHPLANYLFDYLGVEHKTLSYSENKKYTIVACNQVFYNLPYFEIMGIRYYDIFKMTTGKPVNQFRIHEEEAARTVTKDGLVINFNDPVFLSEAEEVRSLNWTFRETKFEFQIKYNPFMAEYFQFLPTLQYEKYYQYQFDTHFLESFLIPLKKEFIRLQYTDFEIAECLRQMILQCFPYIDDSELYGYEHVQLVPEILMTEGADCEDRSILLVQLIRFFTDLESYLADFPEHVSVIIQAPENWTKKDVKLQGKPFVYCDPTYFNSPFGSLPASLEDIKPDILLDD